MTDKKRIADLERRVRELEARPFMPTIIIQPVAPALMPPPYVPGWIPEQPWAPSLFEPGKPVWYVDFDSLPRC